MEIGGGKKRKKKNKENEEKASRNATRVELSSKHLCFVFFNPHTICNPCTPTYTYIMYTCTIYSPKTTSGCIHTRLVHENPPTHIHTPGAQAHTHSTIDTTQTFTLSSFTHTITFSHLQVASTEEKKENKKSISPRRFLFSARVPVVCAHNVLLFLSPFFFLFVSATSSRDLLSCSERGAHCMHEDPLCKHCVVMYNACLSNSLYTAHCNKVLRMIETAAAALN